MKKIIASILVATVSLGLFSCGNGDTPTTEDPVNTDESSSQTTDSSVQPPDTQNPLFVGVTEGFDDKNIVLQFGAVSDIHTSTSAGTVQHALEVLKETALLYTEKGIEAVVVAGDLTNAYTSDQATKIQEATQVKEVYEKVFDPAEVPMIFALGNHDHDFRNSGASGASLQVFMETIGKGNESAYSQYDVECSDSANGSRHCVINGYHFLFVEPITYACSGADDSGAKYQAATKEWLDQELAAITAENPNQYVFVITHPMIYGTVYGSDLLTSGIYWYTKDLTSTLDKYPQVVTFGGHLHFPINDERSIMQTKFTSLGCGSVQYMAIENGNYEDMQSATVMKDANEVSSGYLVQVDKDGNIRFIRIDFERDASIKTPWVISAPSSDGSHLNKYSEARANSNQAPVLPEDAISVTDNSDTGEDILVVKVNFKSGTDDDVIHHYVLTVKNGDNVMTSSCKKILADYYKNPQVSDMKKEWSFNLGTGIFDRGSKYTFSLVAYDTWGAASNEVVYTYEPKLDLENATIPEPYIDIDFSDGNATDTKGKSTIELIGATISDTELKHGGVSKTLPALNISEEGQYAKLTLNGFADNFDLQDFIKEDGLTIEAVYVNRSKSGTQSIISGRERNGIGVYEQDGRPAFDAYVGSKMYTAEYEKTSSAEELVHVLAVYSRTTSASTISVYVNGEKASTVVSGMLKVQENNHNILYIGANCSFDGTANENVSDMSLADLKIYSERFTHAQAIVRYQNFVKEFSK